MELSGLFVYPVKSCRGVALQSGVVSATGALCGSRKLPIAMERTAAALGLLAAAAVAAVAATAAAACHPATVSRRLPLA